jgi:poly(3-hydroxyalkanoate) depolymerase
MSIATRPAGDELAAPTVSDLTVFGHKVRVQVRGGVSRLTPLVLCFGIGASFDALDRLVAELGEDREIICFDVPGVGASPPPLLPYAFPQLATLVMRMLRQLGYDRVDVLGYSWGGAPAQQLAAKYPRKVRRVVLPCTGTGALMVPGNPRVLSRMLSPRRFRDPEYAASVAALLYGGTARARSDEVLEVFQHQLGGSRRGYLYQLLAGSVWTSLPFLWLIRQPTLVLVGEDFLGFAQD